MLTFTCTAMTVTRWILGGFVVSEERAAHVCSGYESSPWNFERHSVETTQLCVCACFFPFLALISKQDRRCRIWTVQQPFSSVIQFSANDICCAPKAFLPQRLQTPKWSRDSFLPGNKLPALSIETATLTKTLSPIVQHQLFIPSTTSAQQCQRTPFCVSYRVLKRMDACILFRFTTMADAETINICGFTAVARVSKLERRAGKSGRKTDADGGAHGGGHLSTSTNRIGGKGTRLALCCRAQTDGRGEFFR